MVKQTTKIALIASISTIIGIALVIGVGGVVVTTLFHALGGSGSGYSAQVKVLDAAQKTYAASKTAEIGPYDVTVVSTQRGYTPTATEAAAAQKVLDQYQRSDTINGYPDQFGYSLTEETGQYVLVTLTITHNPARAGYDTLATTGGDWMRQFGEMQLSKARPLVVTPDLGVRKVAREMESSAKTKEGLGVTLLYRIPKATDVLTLRYEISIFTKTAPIVGTEGMPSKDYEYTISIQ